MFKILTFIGLFWAAASVQAQSFSIDELLAFQSKTFTEFAAMVRDKKFSGSDKIETKDLRRLEYSLFVEPTTDIEHFKALLAQAVKLGCKAGGKGRIPGGDTYEDLNRGRSTLRFVTPRNRGIGRPSYAVVAMTAH